MTYPAVATSAAPSSTFSVCTCVVDCAQYTLEEGAASVKSLFRARSRGTKRVWLTACTWGGWGVKRGVSRRVRRGASRKVSRETKTRLSSLVRGEAAVETGWVVRVEKRRLKVRKTKRERRASWVKKGVRKASRFK